MGTNVCAMCVCLFFFLFYSAVLCVLENEQQFSSRFFNDFFFCVQSRTDGLRSSSLRHLITLFHWHGAQGAQGEAEKLLPSVRNTKQFARSFLLVSFLSFFQTREFVRTNYQRISFSSSSSLFWRFRQREKCDARLDITSHPPDPNFPDTFFFFRSFVFFSPSPFPTH